MFNELQQKMTRAELIRKLSKQAGVPDFDTKIFFELFLKRIAANLEKGQSISIDEFGFFHLLEGKIRKTSLDSGSDEEVEELTDLLIYSEERNFKLPDQKGFVFHIPFSEEEDYHPIDSFFSLSIGKPLIPIPGVVSESVYIPSSGYEYKHLLESKIEKIIGQSEILNPEEETPTLIIDSRSYGTNQIHLEWKVEPISQSDIEEDSNIEKSVELQLQSSTELHHIAWDFGDDLSKQIEKDSILDLQDENPIIESQKKISIENNLDWEKIKFEKLKESAEIINQKEINSDVEGKKIIRKLADEFHSIEESNRNNAEVLDNLLNAEDQYQEVKSELKLDDKLTEKEILSDEEFWKSSTKLFTPYIPNKEKAGKDKDFTEVKSTELNIIKTPLGGSPTKLDNHSPDKEKATEEKIKAKKPITLHNDYFEKRHKKSKMPFIILFTALITIGAASFYYFIFLNQSAGVQQTPQLSINSKNTVIVRRDFRIPISYPYLLSNAGEISSDNNIDESKVEIQDIKPEESKTIKPEISISETKPKVENVPPSKSFTNVGSNIYKYGELYVVQVASFRAESIAENEAGKYRNKGLNTFVEAANIPNRGLWYRVRVGNFTSVNEAKDFIKNNNR